MTVHHFADEKCAYDACQTDESVEDGDILVIVTDQGERIIAFADTWPTVLYDDYNAARELHRFADDAARSNHRVRFPNEWHVAESVYYQNYTGPSITHGCLCI